MNIKQTKYVSNLLDKIQTYYDSNHDRQSHLQKNSNNKINTQTKISKAQYLNQFEKRLDEMIVTNNNQQNNLKKSVIEQSRLNDNSKEQFKDIATYIQNRRKLPKTRLCRQFIKTKMCRQGTNCPYAHSIKELDVEYAPIAWTMQFSSQTKLAMAMSKSKIVLTEFEQPPELRSRTVSPSRRLVNSYIVIKNNDNYI